MVNDGCKEAQESLLRFMVLALKRKFSQRLSHDQESVNVISISSSSNNPIPSLSAESDPFFPK